MTAPPDLADRVAAVTDAVRRLVDALTWVDGADPKQALLAPSEGALVLAALDGAAGTVAAPAQPAPMPSYSPPHPCPTCGEWAPPGKAHQCPAPAQPAPLPGPVADAVADLARMGIVVDIDGLLPEHLGDDPVAYAEAALRDAEHLTTARLWEIADALAAHVRATAERDARLAALLRRMARFAANHAEPELMADCLDAAAELAGGGGE